MVEKKIQKLRFFFVALCIFQLLYIFHFRSGFKYEVIKDPFEKNSGIAYSLSPEIIEVNNILINQKAIDFNLSDKLKRDIYFYQRSIEFNYPIKINGKSKLIFFLNDEGIPNICKVIESGKYLKLTQC